MRNGNFISDSNVATSVLRFLRTLMVTVRLLRSNPLFFHGIYQFETNLSNCNLTDSIIPAVGNHVIFLRSSSQTTSVMESHRISLFFPFFHYQRD